MKCAYFDISPECLVYLLHLPEGTEIMRVFMPTDGASLKPTPDVRVVVSGPALPEVPEGGPMSRVSPMYKIIDGKDVFHSWGEESKGYESTSLDSGKPFMPNVNCEVTA